MSLTKATYSMIEGAPVNVLDFGADPTGATDSTAAFTAAQGAALYPRILMYIPKGTYKLDNFRLKSGVVMQGEGYTSTIIQQANTTNPAINVLADASTGQIVSAGITKLRVKGLNSAGASAVKLEAIAPYVVSFGDYDFHAEEVSTALEIVIGLNNEVYSNKFNIVCIGAKDTAFITKGVYNEYRLEAVLCGNGYFLDDTSINSNFYYCVGDGTASFSGQNCTIADLHIETIYGASAYDSCAVRLGGFNHVLTNPTVVEVANAKAPNAFSIFNQHILLSPRIYGTNTPNFPFALSASGAPTLMGGGSACPNKIEAYTSAAALAKCTFLGDTSTYTTNATLFGPAFTFVNAASYTIDANKGTKGLDRSIMVGYAAGTCTLTLPSGAEFIGRRLWISTRENQTVVSASANVTPLTGGTGTAILAATAGKWAMMEYDGTTWGILANN